MNLLSLDYRDPLYGIIVLIAIVFITYFSTYWWGEFKNKEEETNIKKFVNKFDQYDSFNDYKELIQKKDLPYESAILMALTYEKSGEYEKAIEIYLALLKNAIGPQKRTDILTLLGKTYYKAGFLKKSEEILLTSLRLHPKNEEALTYLSVIYEILREYDKAVDVLDTLNELGSDVEQKRIYFNTLSIINNKHLNNKQKLQHLKELGLEKRIVQRKIFEFIKLNNLTFEKEILEKLDLQNVIDLLWTTDYNRFDPNFVKQNRLLSEIFTAKGDIEAVDGSENFELNMLIKLQSLKDNSADLSFSYICDHCKHLFPIYFYRCPKCQQIDTNDIEINLTKKSYEKGSFI
ncbi:MAG: tetratricopeptide repeat protein [Sulfurospirillum sp.]|nr:MAG: tetratricopeptide repeat protein [Sulfurospirillum sp.]